VPAVGLNAICVINLWRVELQFYSDEGLTNFLAEHDFSMGIAAASTRGLFATLGPWMQIFLTPSAAGSALDIDAWAANQPATYTQNAAHSILIQQFNIAIGIGATNTHNAGRLWYGNAFLCFQMRAGTASLEIQDIDHNGVASRIWRRQLTAAQPVGEIIPLPSRTVRVVVINTSGAAQNYDLFLLAQPHVMRS
jgi:hypothetical protein